MTAVGKILIFFVLLLSVATSALMVFAYQARTNWKVSAQKNAALAQVAEAAYRSELDGRKLDRARGEDTAKALDTQLNTARELVKSQGKQIDDHQKVLAEKDNAFTAQNTTQARLTEELSRLKTEREDFNKKYNQLQEAITVLTNKNGDLEKASAVTTNKLSDSERRKDAVTVELQKAVAEMASLRAGNATPGSNGKSTVPAPANVRGLVTYVGSTGLVQIDVGADSNLQVGNEIFVARMKPAPMFLGTIKLTRVNPKEAVGQFIPAGRNDKIQIGDEVRSSLTK